MMAATARKDRSRNAERVRLAGSTYRPLALTAYGGTAHRTTANIKEMAEAFEAAAPIKTFYGQPTRSRRLTAALAIGARAEPAEQVA